MTAADRPLRCVTCGRTGPMVVLQITGSGPAYAECSAEYSILCQAPERTTSEATTEERQ
jgi:hypothetical protein